MYGISYLSKIWVTITIFVSRVTHYYQLIGTIYYYQLIRTIYLGHELAQITALKRTKIQLKLLPDTDMQLIVEKRIIEEIFYSVIEGIFYSIIRYVSCNNKYMKSQYENKDPSYLTCLNRNNSHELAVSKKLPQAGFERRESTLV